MNLKKAIEIRNYICAGCKTFLDWGGDKEICPSVHKKNGHVCPCSECLIKMVCETECDVFKIFAGERGHAKLLNPCAAPDYTWHHKSPQKGI